MLTSKIAEQLNSEMKEKQMVEVLQNIASKFEGKIVFTSSFGIEDQVITDYIFKNDIPIKIITLDTGRLFEETHKVFNRTIEKYNNPIYPYYPKNEDLEKFVYEKRSK